MRVIVLRVSGAAAWIDMKKFASSPFYKLVALHKEWDIGGSIKRRCLHLPTYLSKFEEMKAG